MQIPNDDDCPNSRARKQTNNIYWRARMDVSHNKPIKKMVKEEYKTIWEDEDEEEGF